MTDREKLVGLLDNFGIDDDWYTNTEIADYLLANDVTFVTDNNDGGKWIPVSERLPEIGDRCLCNVKSFAFPGSFYQEILKYDKYGFVEGCIYTDDVTHWIPLPEPPKEEK